jgi:hypothetical protein
MNSRLKPKKTQNDSCLWILSCGIKKYHSFKFIELYSNFVSLLVFILYEPSIIYFTFPDHLLWKKRTSTSIWQGRIRLSVDFFPFFLHTTLHSILKNWYWVSYNDALNTCISLFVRDVFRCVFKGTAWKELRLCSCSHSLSLDKFWINLHF